MKTTLPLRSPAGLPPLRLDPAIRNQAQRVHHALRAAILDGLLLPGARLPSSRDVARQLGIGRNMIVVAYETLISDGLIEATRGSGTYVSDRLPASPAQILPSPSVQVQTARRPFALGCTHVDDRFLGRLANATRRHIAGATKEDLGYSDPRGSLRLRQKIAEFLRVHRGMRCDAACIIVTGGTQHGLRLCAEALLQPSDRVWFEEPGYGNSRAALLAAGLQVVPVPVDARGVDVQAGILRAPDAKAVFVTPSHQFPTGVRMTMERRTALLDWANATGAWVFEDDYDSEFRYAGPPLTALAGLSAARVIYLGTFSKTLFAGLRMGYAVVPPQVLDRVLRARTAMDRFTPVFMQEAVADLMTDGTIATHLRRNTRQYRADRVMVADILREQSNGLLRPEFFDHGLHMIAWLPPNVPSAEIRTLAGIDAVLVSETCMETPVAEGFVLGFSGYGRVELQQAATRLAMAVCTVANGIGGLA